MAVRARVKVGNEIYAVWLRVDFDGKSGFPKAFREKLEKLTQNPQTAKHVRTLKDSRIIIDSTLFELLQEEIDRMQKCRVSLFVVNRETGESKSVVMNAKAYGADRAEYDTIKRYLYY